LHRHVPNTAALEAVEGWRSPAQGLVPDWYVLADGLLGIRSTEEAFLTRLRSNYRECASSAGQSGPLPHVLCTVGRLEPRGAIVVEFEGAPPLGDPDFPRRILTLRHRPTASGRDGWWRVDPDHPVGEVAYSRDRVLIDGHGPWQSFVASLAVSRCLATQAGILFYHAAANRVNGCGVLLLGVSGSGKTSVSLALASRGHAFYGDDIVGVRVPSQELVPLRRAAHVRQGPAGVGVRAALSSSTSPSDSGQRIRADVGLLFPAAAARPARADYVICLRRFADRTRLERFRPNIEDVVWLTPHASALAAGPVGRQAMRIVSLFAASRCFFLDSASPESAADALERLTECTDDDECARTR